LGVALAGLPLVERLRIKSLDGGGESELLLTTRYASLDQVEDEFWQAFEGLDRQALLEKTVALLAQTDQPLTLADLAQALPPSEHDLETLALWLALAREAGVPLDDGPPEHITLTHADQPWRFTVPRVRLVHQAVQTVATDL
jgi:hypothetical protein